MKVCIDAGHGGYQVGRVGRYSTESVLNLYIAKRLEKALRKLDYITIMTRRQDRYVSLSGRASFANRYKADLFVSIHCNAQRAGGVDVHGIETWYYKGSTSGRKWARVVQRMLTQRFPTHRNRGLKYSDNLTVLEETAMPAILVECEFLSNPRMEHFLNDFVNQRNIAKAIADGIDKQVRNNA